MHRVLFWFSFCSGPFCCCMLLQRDGTVGLELQILHFLHVCVCVYMSCVNENFSSSLFHPCRSSPYPSPNLWKWTLRCGYEGEDEVCSKFSAMLAKQPVARSQHLQVLSSQPEFPEQSPDPEFPDKEMFMGFFFFFLKRSPLPQVWGWKKTKPPRRISRVARWLYGYVACIVCLITER